MRRGSRFSLIALALVAMIAAVAVIRSGGGGEAPGPAAETGGADGAAARRGSDGLGDEGRDWGADGSGRSTGRHSRSGTLSGRVVDAAGHAAPGALVALEGTLRAQSRAADDGGFRFTGLPAGEFLLHASLDVRASDPVGPVPLGPGEDLRDLTLVIDLGAALSGTVRDRRDGSAIAGATVSAGAASVQSDDKGRYRLLGLPAGLVRVSAAAEGFLARTSEVELTRGREKTGGDIHLERAGRVHGKVAGADGAAIPSVEIYAARYSLGARQTELAAVGLTDEEGRFAGTVPPGRLQLVARASGFAESRTEEFDVAAGENHEANLTLSAGGGIDGRVRDREGAPVAGCRAQAFDAVHGRTLAEGFSDAQGLFWIRGIPAAIYSVVASCASGRAEASGIAVSEGPAAQVELTLGASTVAGHVVDGAGKPIAGAAVSARVDGSAAPETPIATTGADGAFSAAGLSGERFTLSAVAAQGRAERGGIAAGSRDVVLVIAATELVGRVEGDRTEPIPDFTIYAEPAQIGEGRPRSQRFVSPTGEFRMPLPPGRYTVRAGAPGYGPATVPDVVVSESGGRVRITLSRGAVVRGRVVDGSGQGLGGARVASSFDMLFEYGRTASVPNGVFAVADAQGRFELAGVPTGRRVWIFAAKDGYEQVDHPMLSASAGQEVPDISVHMKPTNAEPLEPEFGGVGMSLSARREGVVVIDAFEGGPGREAGIRPGDQIVAIDGVPTAGRSLGDIVQSIRGPVGTSVLLVVRRDGRDTAVPVARVSVKL